MITCLTKTGQRGFWSINFLPSNTTLYRCEAEPDWHKCVISYRSKYSLLLAAHMTWYKQGVWILSAEEKHKKKYMYTIFKTTATPFNQIIYAQRHSPLQCSSSTSCVLSRFFFSELWQEFHTCSDWGDTAGYYFHAWWETTKACSLFKLS